MITSRYRLFDGLPGCAILKSTLIGIPLKWAGLSTPRASTSELRDLDPSSRSLHSLEEHLADLGIKTWELGPALASSRKGRALLYTGVTGRTPFWCGVAIFVAVCPEI
jgi:hypothetical protein